MEKDMKEIEQDITDEEKMNFQRFENLRKNINDEDYLFSAIQRIASVLSNELVDMSLVGGRYNERQRKRQP